ncbi:MerR family transcriptional regulator [Novosphingobium sp. PC22D]|uniref:MerR family transcriptional regulator n=1 Tax=Novosphingobium sp. PC22D TaxID=1962403 RepID=UPI001F0B6D9F|nr:MerR family transcriptional regulator [Novosphingobium sp. PC22D]
MSRAVFTGFDDGKDPEALRTIGEVTRALGIRQHVLRYWEEQFPMLKPIKRSGGRRYYRPEDVALVAEIDRLVHHEGYTLRGARLALETKASGNGSGAETAAAPAVQPAASVVERLRAVRDDLAAALDRA